MYKAIALVSIICLVTGCATRPLADHQLTDQLVPEHGWLAISVTSPNDNIAFELTAGEIGTERYKTPAYDKGDSIKLMQLPAGYYRLSGLYDRTIIWEFVHPEALDEFAFNVTPGGLTLLGQVTVNGDTLSLQPFNGESSQAALQLAYGSTGADIQRVTADNTPARIWPIGSVRCGGHVVQGYEPCDNAGGFGRLSQGPR